MIGTNLAAWALLLIAVAIAYFVCLKASKEASRLFRIGGYTIGIIILAVSLILAISNVAGRRGRRIFPRRTQQRPATSRPQIKDIQRLPSEIREKIRQQQEQSTK